MRNKIRSSYSFLKSYPSLFFRIFFIFVFLFGTFGYIAIDVFASGQTNFSGTKRNSRIGLNREPQNLTDVPEVAEEDIEFAIQRKESELKRLAEVQRLMAIRQGHIDRINTFLVKKRSPVANTKIPEIIYDLSKKNSADYRVLLAIMGVESGFCAQNFHYNCFGFINGRHYASYEEAFNDLVPKVSRMYAAPFGTNFVALAKAYGMVNWEKGAANLNMYYNQI